MKTKRRKTFTTHFFPVGPKPLNIVSEYVAMLPATSASDRTIRCPPPRDWRRTRTGALPRPRLGGHPGARRDQFARFSAILLRRQAAPYVNPHVFRKTLIRLGETLCRSPEEWKAWSQNLGHESEMTTFVGYGQVPDKHRQAEMMRTLSRPRTGEVRGARYRRTRSLPAEREGGFCGDRKPHSR